MTSEESEQLNAIYRSVVHGIPASERLMIAARKVVWARHCNGDDGWDKLKNAIGELEDLVGSPPNA